MVLIFIFIYFEWRGTENQEYTENLHTFPDEFVVSEEKGFDERWFFFLRKLLRPN